MGLIIELRKMYNFSPLSFIFISVTLISIIFFVMSAIISGGYTAIQSTCPDKHDLFMDYFNSIMYSIDDPYSKHHVIYPPLITVVYATIGHYLMACTNIEISDLPLSFALRDSYFGMLSYFMFAIIALFGIYSLMNKCGDKKNNWITLALLISFPLLYAVARGNSIVYALIFIVLFLMYYKSENKVLRIFSYVFLGISIGIKIFPAIFILLVIRERKWRDIIECAVICLFLFLGPFILTDGSILDLISTAFNYTSSVFLGEALNIKSMMFVLFGSEADNSLISVLSNVVIIAIYVITFFLVIFKRSTKDWAIYFLLSCSIVLGFGTPAAYNFSYLIIPALVFFVKEKDANAVNMPVLICLILIFLTYTCFGIFTIQIANSIRGWTTLLLFVMMVFFILRDNKNIIDPIVT